MPDAWLPLRMPDANGAKPSSKPEGQPLVMIKAVRGTRDLLPPETALWNWVEAGVRDVFRAYNFHEIRTPMFEETQLFARGVGEETDIVAKEMYTWEDRGRALQGQRQRGRVHHSRPPKHPTPWPGLAGLLCLP